ncbi:C-type lectin LmsL [Pogona vitticeps]
MEALGVFLHSLLVIHFFLQGSEGLDCPKHWMEYEDLCFGVMESPIQWTDAEAECQIKGNGGHLASIHKDTELRILSNKIKNNHPDVQELWIGLHDSRKTDRWAWTDTNPFNFKPWSADKDKMKGKGFFCAYLSRATDFRTFHVGCCNKARAYICKSSV